ncbi:MAG: hypothetical protein R6V85_16450 [Polyangia bacterium]
MNGTVRITVVLMAALALAACSPAGGGGGSGSDADADGDTDGDADTDTDGDADTDTGTGEPWEITEVAGAVYWYAHYEIRGAADDDIYVSAGDPVDRAGSVHHWDGSAWSEEAFDLPAGQSLIFTGLGGFGEGQIHVWGERWDTGAEQRLGAALLARDSGGWEEIALPGMEGDQALIEALGGTADAPLAVGLEHRYEGPRRAWRRQSGSWEDAAQEIPALAQVEEIRGLHAPGGGASVLYGSSGTDPDDVGHVFLADGSLENLEFEGGAVVAVWGEGPDDLTAVTDRALYAWDGSQWSELAASPFDDIGGRSWNAAVPHQVDEIYLAGGIGGDSGDTARIDHFDGEQFQRVFAPCEQPNCWFDDLWVSDEFVYAVGGMGDGQCVVARLPRAVFVE